MAKPGAPSRGTVMAIFFFDADVEPLFPYLNAEIHGAELYDTPAHLRFEVDRFHAVLYPDRCMATPFDDRAEAAAFRDRMMERLNDILKRRDAIKPKYRIFTRASVPDILKLLPLSNCGACGFPTCLAFASMLSRQKISPWRCPHMEPPVSEQVSFAVKDAGGKPVSTLTLNVDREAEISSPMVDTRRVEKANATLLAELSPREVEVLVLLGQGDTNREISKKLAISPHTVKSHVIHLFNKLGVSDRTQAAVWAARQNLF